MSGVHALVLAAGSGERFGGGKLMAPFRGGRLIDAALAAALAAPVEQVFVTIGDDAALARHLAGRRDLRLVPVADARLGLSASLKAGLAALPPGATGVLVFLGDMPLVPHAVLPRLVAAIEGGAPAAVPVFEGRRGHPAALGQGLFAAVAALHGDQGAGRLLDGLGEALVRIPCADAGVLLDIDTPGDLGAVTQVS